MGLVNGNGLPIEVPNLGAIGQVDPATWVQQNIFRGAGVTQGGRSLVTTGDGCDYELHGTELVVMAMPPMMHILCVMGRDPAGAPVTIPWHAVLKFSAA